MAVTSLLTSILSFYPGLLAFALLALISYRLLLSPLKHIPGPLSCRLTSLWTYLHSYLGDEATLITSLHNAYGPVLLVAPNEVCIADGAALAPIYSTAGGFKKAPCYRNFDVDGFPSLFSETEKENRAPRAKSVASLFSTASLRDGGEVLTSCVVNLVERMKAGRAVSEKQGTPLNVLNLGRGLAVDAVSAYLFRRSYGGLSEGNGAKGEARMSASEFVDAFVAVGRFFYLPSWVFVAVEMASGKLFGTHEQEESMTRVDAFVKRVVDEADPGDGTYPGRMLKAGLSPDEVEAQCKDLMFAGTDSSGMNLSTLCWNLAKHPEIYTLLRKELTESRQQDPSYDAASLPYLRACIREALRLSMANPTRLPRLVPQGGWIFHCSINDRTYHFPAGTLISCQIHTLHHNSAVFPDPFAFKPERWLESDGYSPSAEMQRDFIPFGLGARQCIARNLAMTELVLAAKAIVESNVLGGARAVGEKIEIREWFNSKVKGERIELSWAV